MWTSIYFRNKANGRDMETSMDAFSLHFYNLAVGAGSKHDEAANFQGWVELAAAGECYDCPRFYAEVIEK